MSPEAWIGRISIQSNVEPIQCFDPAVLFAADLGSRRRSLWRGRNDRSRRRISI